MTEPTEGKKHAWLNPSGADRWMVCQGSALLTKDLPEETSKYAEEGTDYHTLAAICLEENTNAEDYDGQIMESGAVVELDKAKILQEGYIDPVRAYAQGGSLQIEQRLPLSWYTGDSEEFGTSDASILREDRELIIADLKFGMGVEVSPERNRQEMIYAISYIERNELWDDLDSVRLVILQPRIGDGKPKEWVMPISELREFKETVVKTAFRIRTAHSQHRELPLVADEKACRFCKAKGTCPALRAFVEDAMKEGFENLEDYVHPTTKETVTRAVQLGHAMDKVDLVEIWMKGVQAQVEIDLLAGKTVTGKDGDYKLVQGKRGNRKWTDEEGAEELLKSFRLPSDDIYNKKIISPTDAEKLLAKTSPKRWTKCETLISQSEGSLHVAPATDKRPARVVEKPEDGFEVLEAVAAGDDDFSDLV